MPPGQIQPQDPSLSPTYSLSSHQPQPAIPSSIRRNLFASHLSRRPVASTSQNPFNPPSPHREELQSDIYHARSSQQAGQRASDYEDMYGLCRPVSATPTTFPRDTSIVAVNPATGRPLLPNIPVLPARLHLGDDDVEEESEETDRELERSAHPGYVRSPAIHNRLNVQAEFDLDLDLDLDLDQELDGPELARFGAYHRAELGLDTFLDLHSEDSRRERERIEHLLAEMQARQRARARAVTEQAPSSSSTAGDLSFASALRVSSRLTTKSNRQPATTRTRSQRAESPSTSDHTRPRDHLITSGGIGPSMDPAEKDELTGLIMTSLRRKLHTAEEEGWMYGGAEGLGGIGLGAAGDDMPGYE